MVLAIGARGPSIFAETNRFCRRDLIGIAIKRNIGFLSHQQQSVEEKKTPGNYSNCTNPPPCLRSELLCPVVEPLQDGLNKVSVVGAGAVGIACCKSILYQKISSHVALVDAFPKKLQGEGIDLSHGLIYLGSPRFEYDTDFCITSNSRVVIIAAGARQCKHESHLDLVQRNVKIVKNIISPLTRYSPKAVFIIATNPVDTLSWLAWKISGLPVNRVIGSGCHVDTARFRSIIAKRIGVAAHSVHGFVVGEHGDSQVPLWSGVSIAGVQFRDVVSNIGLPTDEEKWFQVRQDVIHASNTVRCLKGYMDSAIALAIADIVKDVLGNAQSVKAVSTLVQGHYGIEPDIFLSLPCCVGENGIVNVVRVRMTELEQRQLLASADAVHAVRKTIKLNK